MRIALGPGMHFRDFKAGGHGHPLRIDFRATDHGDLSGETPQRISFGDRASIGEGMRHYDAGSAMTYAKDLKGRLLIYYGTADNNVHPANSLQLIKALQDAGKSFDVQVGPDRGHGSLNQDRMMEFFIEALRP